MTAPHEDNVQLDPEMVERGAEAIHRHEGGLGDDEDWKATYGDKPRRLWKTDAPWDTNPNELCEWERDDYRAQARAAIQAAGLARRWDPRVTAIYEAAFDLCNALVDKGVQIVGAERAIVIGQYARRLADKIAAAPPSLAAAARGEDGHGDGLG